MMKLLLLPFYLSLASAFVIRPNARMAATRPLSMSSVVNGASDATQSTSAAAVRFVQDFLDDLRSSDQAGAHMIDRSSFSWRSAIYEAVGAPASADEKIVSKAVLDAMSKPDNQFAILLGNAEDYVIDFPSDPVEDDESYWVETRLRAADDDDLLVTMGIELQKKNGDFVVHRLDWQDFRDAFYPGLSGREWLRAF